MQRYGLSDPSPCGTLQSSRTTLKCYVALCGFGRKTDEERRTNLAAGPLPVIGRETVLGVNGHATVLQGPSLRMVSVLREYRISVVECGSEDSAQGTAGARSPHRCSVVRTLGSRLHALTSPTAAQQERRTAVSPQQQTTLLSLRHPPVHSHRVGVPCCCGGGSGAEKCGWSVVNKTHSPARSKAIASHTIHYAQ